MTWPACGAEDRACPAEAGGHPGSPGGGSSAANQGKAEADLQVRQGGDGSFSLWSSSFGEGFHSGRGALREARETFVLPSQLERFGAGRRLKVVEVCVGTGTNLAMLLERCAALGIDLEWWGLELTAAPLALALGEAEFREQWQAETLLTLEALQASDGWRGAGSRGEMLWGDARRTLPVLLEQQRGQVDRVWHDAFSPQHCPQLWTVEVLGSLAALLAPEGRWISYCSAAAVREGLRLAGLQLAALSTPDVLPRGGQPLPGPQASAAGEGPGPEVLPRRGWSGGTVASTSPLPASPLWRPLSAMEQEHQASGAGEPYRDPSGAAPAATILAARRDAQAKALAIGRRSSGSAWRRRWGLEGRTDVMAPPVP